MCSVALAQESYYDEEIGCMMYEGYAVCDQAADISDKGLQVKFLGKAECGTLLGEEWPCSVQVELLQDLSFQQCQLKVTETESGIDMDENYNCQDIRWEKGSRVDSVAFKDSLDNCIELEGDEYYAIEECDVVGWRVLVTSGAAQEIESEPLLTIEHLEEQGGFLIDQTTLMIIGAICLIFLIFVGILWTRKR